MNKTEVEDKLPKVGDILYKRPYGSFEKLKCVVTFVNYDKLWYAVRFDMDKGSFIECYKLPNYSFYPKSGYIYVTEREIKNTIKPTRVKIVESGEIFDSVSDCAKRLGRSVNAIRYALKNKSKIDRFYHVVYEE